MASTPRVPDRSRPSPRTSALERRLRREADAEVRFGAFDRARYSADASIYQIEPLGVVLPRSREGLGRTLSLAAEEGVPVIPRGAGTSQSGQAVGPDLVVDVSRHLRGRREPDLREGTVQVAAGTVLDELNRDLAPSGLYFPVDVATASRATLGGMAANDSAGARSIRYGSMARHVVGLAGYLADGTPFAIGTHPPPAPPDPTGRAPGDPLADPRRAVAGILQREAGELRSRIPRVARHVAGYGLHRLLGGDGTPPADPAALDLTPLLVGSEGTLAVLTDLTLRLAERPAATVLGVCAFPDLHRALDAVQHLVRLEPTAVELVDGTLLALARDHPVFVPTLRRVVRREADALLLVEFAGPDADAVRRRLEELEEVMAGFGLPDAVVRAVEPAFQAEIWSVRRTALNIVTSMKGARRPVSFVEDCAVPLERLAEYGDRVEGVFRRHGARGTWYAHASVGCLHVRPALDLSRDEDLARLRGIAEEVHAVVRDLGGSHSGEHGDGLVRSEFLESMLGPRIVRAFEEVKAAFDPEGRLNPGKIVRPPPMDSPALLRARKGERPLPVITALDWSAEGGWAAAAGRCNNNGACRKMEDGSLCPSYRVTRDETHVTRGRANTLRMVLTGQLGPDALGAPELHEALDLCVGCKACRRECPMSVDMARMKVEFLHHWHRQHRRSLRDRLVAELPRWAPLAGRLGPVATPPTLATRLLGFAPERTLPRVAAEPFRPPPARGRRASSPESAGTGITGGGAPGGGAASARGAGPGRSSGGAPGGRATEAPEAPSRGGPEPRAAPERAVAEAREAPAADRGPVVLLADTFTTWFEPEQGRAAVRVLEAGGYGVVVAGADPDGGWRDARPPCCGRTYLTVGMVEAARREARRLLDAVDAADRVLAGSGPPRPVVDGPPDAVTDGPRDGSQGADERTVGGAALPPVVGLEPSCLLTLRDELTVLFPPGSPDGERARRLADRALLVTELLARDGVALPPGGRSAPRAATPPDARRVLVHGHCHSKAFGVDGAALQVLRRIPGLDVERLETGCCGMAGAFGYEAEHYDASMAMAERELLPAVRAAGPGEVIVADGTSCRAQILHGTGRSALHPVVLLDRVQGAVTGTG